MATLRCSTALQSAGRLRQPCARRRYVCARAADVPKETAPALSTVELSYNRLLLTILDGNPFLSDGSKTAVATAALLAKQYSSKVTVLVVDEPGTENADPSRRLESIGWHLKERGCLDYEVVERAITSPASVLVGDVADEISADMVVLSSEAVHAKHVDANQLAEFVSCPVLLLP
ncbi:hypothetical protein HYH03_012289 [Edaphochlamys debaryana]|uniref:UspA domain-containing protein n=1 Tax=Edaphochlamys debaryana TaxID=47281 RepID=A0A835XT52_9CHLO|nr:hypothetical protein HYH03_012289 [Edaphochlamys debaryana]|eukprot:KAG2489269.1 hypothetical protein HYH03_012289 [Edaphochlamys debaryana]